MIQNRLLPFGGGNSPFEDTLTRREVEEFPHLKRRLEAKEEFLGKRSKRLWIQGNSQKVLYLYSKMVNPLDKTDTTIVTLAYWHDAVRQWLFQTGG